MSLNKGLIALAVMTATSACTDTSTDDNPETITITETHTIYETITHTDVDNSMVEVSATSIDELVSRMTLKEKVGQMVQAEIRSVAPGDVEKYHLGSVLNGGGRPFGGPSFTVDDWLEYADMYYNESISDANGRIGIPTMWGTDAVHGHSNAEGATVFPHNIGLGAANNPELMHKIGEITAQEVRVTGVDWAFAPTLAVTRDDRWGRTYESYSEDPAIVAGLADDIVKGLQGDQSKSAEFLNENHIIATAKHFVGDGGTVDGDDRGENLSTLEELLAIHGAGYPVSIDAGVQTVMVSYSSALGEKMHGNKYLLTDVLRGEMGFEGFVIGDWDGHAEVAGCKVYSCPQAVNAGIDMFMVPNDWKGFIANTLYSIEAGDISEDRIDEAVKRILTVKKNMGLFDQVQPSDRALAGQSELMGAQESRDVARQAVRESLVLLKNENDILPLSRNQKVLVAGGSANSMQNQHGGWTLTWQGWGDNAEYIGATTILAGIENTIAGSTGSVEFIDFPETFEFEADSKPDVVVYVFGEYPYAEYFGDRDDWSVQNFWQEESTLGFQTEYQYDLWVIQQYKDAGIPVVGVFVSGRPLVITEEITATDAFVAAWLPGSEGDGIAEVLFKNDAEEINYDFKGKLSFSWPQNIDDTFNVGDPSYSPLYEFGYGLTYE